MFKIEKILHWINDQEIPDTNIFLSTASKSLKQFHWTKENVESITIFYSRFSLFFPKHDFGVGSMMQFYIINCWVQRS